MARLVLIASVTILNVCLIILSLTSKSSGQLTFNPSGQPTAQGDWGLNGGKRTPSPGETDAAARVPWLSMDFLSPQLWKRWQQKKRPKVDQQQNMYQKYQRPSPAVTAELLNRLSDMPEDEELPPGLDVQSLLWFLEMSGGQKKKQELSGSSNQEEQTPKSINNKKKNPFMK